MKELILSGTIEVGTAIMKVVFCVTPEELERESNWMIVSYLYQVDESEDDGVAFGAIPSNASATQIRMSRKKVIAIAEAAPNLKSAFIDIIGYRVKNPTDLSMDVITHEDEEMN